MFNVYLHVKNKLNPSLLSCDITPILLTYFGYFGHSWLWPPKTLMVLVENFDVYLHAQKSVTSLSKFCKIFILHTLGMSGHVTPTKNNSINL